jgi:hypothetical protein
MSSNRSPPTRGMSPATIVILALFAVGLVLLLFTYGGNDATRTTYGPGGDQSTQGTAPGATPQSGTGQ